VAVRVLIVDDSSFFRRCLNDILTADKHIEVIGMADNGVDAVEKTAQLKPDVITMDIEMPVMDGITAVREIMKSNPTPILMFSSLTTHGAQATLDALDAGALDFMPKQMDDIAGGRNNYKRQLCAKIRIIGAKGITTPELGDGVSISPLKNRMIGSPSAIKLSGRVFSSLSDFDLVVIGTSTGGPVALQKVLVELPENFPLPIVLVEHMPASFTPAFAKRLDSLCAISVKHADNGDLLEKGTALLAPGGCQLEIDNKNGKASVRVAESDPSFNYKPSVDVAFSSAAEAYPGRVLAIVLTGMGADGREGAKLLKANGSMLWAQDKESCVVYGMPMAVAEAGLVDEVLPLSAIGKKLATGV